MNILFICENYIPHYGGAEVVFKNLAEGFVKQGHYVKLITHQLKGTKKKESMGGVQVSRIPSLHSRYIFSFSAIWSALKYATKADVIQTTTFNGALPAWVAAKLRKKPVVLTVHEVWVGKWQEVTGFSWLKSTVHSLLERLLYILPFDHYVCVSDATKKDLLSIGIQEDKVTTVHNGLDYEFWDPAKFAGNKIRKKLNLEGKFTFFSWGRPGPSKGFEYLINAIPSIVKQNPKAFFLIMWGSIDKYKEKYEELTKLIKKFNVEKHVQIIPSVPYEELGNYVKVADCVIVPSIAEGFGYTTVESIAMKKPVIVSDAGSLPEVVSGEYCMFTSKDSEDLATKAGQAIQGKFKEKPVKKFLWSSAITKYLKIYQRLKTSS